jgi:hypothetical protein
MEKMLCPHCKSHRIVTAKVPRDVVVVMPCPACHELSVLFRNKVIPINRRIIESGTFEERKNHLAHVIAEFLEPSMFGLAATENDEAPDSLFEEADDALACAAPSGHEASETGITDEEMERFIRVELKCLDNPAYFKRYFK